MINGRKMIIKLEGDPWSPAASIPSEVLVAAKEEFERFRGYYLNGVIGD